MRPRPKKYGQSCLVCRKRKVRCEGGYPSCANCTKIGENCRYSEQDSTTTRLQNALSRSEQRAEEFNQELRKLLLLDPEECQSTLRTIVGQGAYEQVEPIAEGAERYAAISQQSANYVPPVCVHSSDDVLNDGRDEEEYRTTSRFHTDADDRILQYDSTPEDAAQIAYHKRWLRSNARFQESYEQMAYAGLQNDDFIDHGTAIILLNIYWTWQAPLHNCVYRRSFFRDMVLKGPYFSDFLLYVIYSHASRHVQPTDPRYAALKHGEIFLDRAKLLLLDELKKDKPAIPTIQGLLILGGRQCALGRNSEGWLYTGMAIRMIHDLGLHLPHKLSLSATEPDDFETLKRVYLSAYAWDKSISLCLGRPPSLTNMPYPDHCLFDMGDDEILWKPFYLGELELAYPPVPCLVSSTFSHFIKLSTIINRAYKTVFGPKARTASQTQLQSIEHELHQFYDSMPRELRMDKYVNEATCPPPHICCLNFLYHTALILIYRPFFHNAKVSQHQDADLTRHANEICTREAAAVNVFFEAYGRSFANKNQTYLLSYCVYTAATVELKQVSDSNISVANAAKSRLATTLAMLEEEARQTPGIRRSVDIIKSRLGQQEMLITNASTSQEHSHNGAMNPSSATSLRSELSDNLLSDRAEAQVSITVDGDTQMSQTTLIDMPQWYDPVLNFPTPDVGGGFVPDIPSWYSPFGN